MRIESVHPDLYYLYERETAKFFINPSYVMNKDLIKDYLSNYLQAAEVTSKLLTLKRNNLSDDDFLYYLTRTGYVIFNPQNVIYTLNKTYNRKYKDFTIILTTMTTKYIENGIIQEYLIGYNVLASEDAFIDERLYTKKEIEKLLNNHQILIYNVFESKYEGARFKHEDFEDYDYINLENFLYNKVEIRNNALKYIRSHTGKKEIMAVVHNYLCDLQKIVQDITTQKDKFAFERKFSEACKSEFVKSGQIKRLERLLENTK